MIFEDTTICFWIFTFEGDAMITMFEPATIPMMLDPGLKIPVSGSSAKDIDGSEVAPALARMPLMGALSLCIKLDVACVFNAISEMRNIVVDCIHYVNKKT
jgi:hypothetical protein